MAKCGFCFRKFRSEQAVKGHLKTCSRYKTIKSERSAALGSEPKAAAMPAAPPPVQLSPPIVGPDLTAPLADLVQAMHEFSTKRDAPQTLQQQRRQILQYRTPLGQVTASLRGSAKLAIERELAPLLLEELPFEEVLEIAATIRDACYVPAFTRQAREATRQRVEDERRHKKEVEEFAASRRADRRKSTLIEQAIGQARARCEARRIIGPHRLSLLVDIELRLTEFLAGSEPVPDAHAIIQTVLDARFAEAEAKQAAARAKADAQWHEDVEAVLVLGAVVGLVTLVLHYYPAQMVVIFEWIERTFGLTPGAEAATPTHNASETTPPDASADAHPRSTRRRKYPDTSPSPESPWGNSVGGEPAHA